MLLLIGGGDDVSSPSACRQMVDGARGRSALVRIVVYAGADHGFDRGNLPPNTLAGPSQDETPDRDWRGIDTEARAEAHKLVAEWLTQ
jgi:dienelactone hydrolase